MDDTGLVGGSEADRRRLLERLDEYLHINARYERAKLQDLWSRSEDALYINLNGHSYQGRAHWTRLWQYYQSNVESSYWTPFDIGGVVSDEFAVIWCHRHTGSNWVGAEPSPQPARYGKEFVSRSTMVFRKEDGDWRVVHVHFSPVSELARPGGV